MKIRIQNNVKLLLTSLVVLTLFTLGSCSNEQEQKSDSLIKAIVYDNKGNKLSNVEVKLYDEKQYQAFQNNNRTEPIASIATDNNGIALFPLNYEEWFSKQNERFLTCVVQYGAGESNYRIWSTSRTVTPGQHIEFSIYLVNTFDK